MAEPFDLVVTRKVSRDCLVSFEGRCYSVPFAWTGRMVDVWDTAAAAHRSPALRGAVDGPGRAADAARRARPASVAGLGGATPRSWLEDAVPVAQVARPLDAYVQLMEALR